MKYKNQSVDHMILHSGQQYLSSEVKLNLLLLIMSYSLVVSIVLDEHPSGLIEEDTNQS